MISLYHQIYHDISRIFFCGKTRYRTLRELSYHRGMDHWDPALVSTILAKNGSAGNGFFWGPQHDHKNWFWQKSVEFQIFRLLLLLPTKLTFAQHPEFPSRKEKLHRFYFFNSSSRSLRVFLPVIPANWNSIYNYLHSDMYSDISPAISPDTLVFSPPLYLFCKAAKATWHIFRLTSYLTYDITCYLAFYATFYRHSIHSIWHACLSFLSDMYSGIISDIFADTFSGNLSGILASIKFGSGNPQSQKNGKLATE